MSTTSRRLVGLLSVVTIAVQFPGTVLNAQDRLPARLGVSTQKLTDVDSEVTVVAYCVLPTSEGAINLVVSGELCSEKQDWEKTTLVRDPYEVASDTQAEFPVGSLVHFVAGPGTEGRYWASKPNAEGADWSFLRITPYPRDNTRSGIVYMHEIGYSVLEESRWGEAALAAMASEGESEGSASLTRAAPPTDGLGGAVTAAQGRESSSHWVWHVLSGAIAGLLVLALLLPRMRRLSQKLEELEHKVRLGVASQPDTGWRPSKPIDPAAWDTTRGTGMAERPELLLERVEIKSRGSAMTVLEAAVIPSELPGDVQEHIRSVRGGGGAPPPQSEVRYKTPAEKASPRVVLHQSAGATSGRQGQQSMSEPSPEQVFLRWCQDPSALTNQWARFAKELKKVIPEASVEVCLRDTSRQDVLRWVESKDAKSYREYWLVNYKGRLLFPRPMGDRFEELSSLLFEGSEVAPADLRSIQPSQLDSSNNVIERGRLA